MTRICLHIFISFRLDHIFKNGVSWEKEEGRCAQKVLMGLKCFISHLLPLDECYQFGMDTQSLSGTGDSCHTAQSFLPKIIVSITQWQGTTIFGLYICFAVYSSLFMFSLPIWMYILKPCVQMCNII